MPRPRHQSMSATAMAAGRRSCSCCGQDLALHGEDDEAGAARKASQARRSPVAKRRRHMPALNIGNSFRAAASLARGCLAPAFRTAHADEYSTPHTLSTNSPACDQSRAREGAGALGQRGCRAPPPPRLCAFLREGHGTACTCTQVSTHQRQHAR